MKHAKMILALLLCLCMLPLSALAYTVEPGGAHAAVSYTPAQSGLYAVSVTKDGQTLAPLPAKTDGGAIYDPAVTVSVTTGGAAAQQVDYNVFYLVKGTAYTVQLQSAEGYDDSGEWSVAVEAVEPLALTLNADTLVEGEWFSFTPAEDGSYVIAAAPAPVFVEVLTEGTPSGDWDGYALDKEICRVGMELDYLRSLKAAIAGRQEALDQAEQTYQKALDKLENYNSLIDLADKTGIGSEGSNLFGKKQAVYDALKAALKRGDSSFSFNIPFIGDLFPSLNLPEIDPAVIDEMPEKVTDFPNWLSSRLQSQEGLVGEAKARYEEQKAEQEADQARYDAGIAANPQLEPLIQDTGSETATLRQKVQTDADAIMDGAAALAAAEGMRLVAAQWQNDGDEAMTVALTAGTTYIIHTLSNLETSAAVTDGTVTPDDPDPTAVDKTVLDKAIRDAKKVNTDKYTEETVAAMNEALTAAEAVQADPDATQAEVNSAAKALNDAVKALKEKEDPPAEVDKSALNDAIARAEAIDRDKYTDSSLNALDLALAAAKRVADSSIATQRLVDTTAEALETALNGLQEKEVTPAVDKTALQQAIAAAEGMDKSKYTDDSVAAVNSALDAAKQVNADADATQAEVDSAAKALNDALKALKEKEVTPAVDKTALQAAVDRANAVDTSKYTDDSVAAMQRALETANAALIADNIPQAAVDNAAKALNDAIDALKEKEVTPPVTGADKTALQAAIDQAEAIDRTRYTDDSLAALDRQLAAAKETLADDAATQPQVNLAARRLAAAISALQEKTAPQPPKFVDVPDNAYYAPAVAWAVANGVTTGKDATHFAPKDDCTRAQIVTFLWRANGEPKVTADNPFTDVQPGAYYYDAVLWAVKEGITTGTTATTFSPAATCTRAQAVTFLWRMEHQPDPKVGSAGFVDVRTTDYFATAVLWAVGEGITNGTDATHFSPKVTCSRAQIVTFLYRDKVGA